MTIDYRKLFEAFRRYIDRTLDEMRRCDILREKIEGYRQSGRLSVLFLLLPRRRFQTPELKEKTL